MEPKKGVTHFWHYHKEGSEGTLEVCAESDRVIGLFELLKSDGYTIRAIDALEYDDINDRLDAEG